MDPCPFVRLIVESLALKLPSSTSSTAGSGGIHPSTTPCYAKLKINNFPTQTALIPLCTASSSSSSTAPESSAAAGFHLDPETLRGLSVVTLKISVFTGRMGRRTCGITSKKLLGSVQVSVNLSHADQTRDCVYQSGWMKLSGCGGDTVPRLHMTVRSEPDPRFVFQFGSEPECSPVVFQIQGNIRQPVFSCKFSADRSNRSRSLPSDFNNTSNRSWMRRTLSGDKDRVGKERKGWLFIVYDISGSAVAAASMITPFVPSSPGSDRVSRSNPGAWLILRPNGVSISSWKPWGRLEAWRERGPTDGLGYKFQLNNGVTIAEGTMSVKKGGKFCIDHNSRKLGQSDMGNILSASVIRGFVMGSSVEGEGKVSKPAVEVGAEHVTCMADAALFVALAAAIDLSMDACRLFSHKLRKEFTDEQDSL